MHSNFQQEQLNKFHHPLQELMALNVKTLQSFSYIRPDELSHIKNPEEFLEKSVDLIIANSHKTLDYMHDMFNILEHQWFNMSDQFNETAKKTIDKTQSSVDEEFKNATKFSHSAAKKMKDYLDEGQQSANKIKTKSTTPSKKASAHTLKAKTKSKVSATSAQPKKSASKRNTAAKEKTQL